MPPAMRIRGQLQLTGQPVAGSRLLEVARELIPSAQWSTFVERRSFDLSRVLGGVQCRINVLQTARGIGLAVRLLSAFRPTLEAMNLHPALGKLVDTAHGLVLVTGATGSGKSSTLAALLDAINVRRACHIITVEDPIEYVVQPKKSFIRQREVRRDTPSFEQALLDSLREDPDVLMVGEMRERTTMQLTLDAAETGHLVFSTMHSGTVAEALQRLCAAFPAEIRSGVQAQLASCLNAVIAQRLVYRPELGLRVPECEILNMNSATRAIVRDGRFFKLQSAMTTGADENMWTFERYRRWLDTRTRWYRPQPGEAIEAEPAPMMGADLPPLRAQRPPSAQAGEPDVDALIAAIEKR